MDALDIHVLNGDDDANGKVSIMHVSDVDTRNVLLECKNGKLCTIPLTYVKYIQLFSDVLTDFPPTGEDPFLSLKDISRDVLEQVLEILHLGIDSSCGSASSSRSLRDLVHGKDTSQLIGILNVANYIGAHMVLKIVMQRLVILFSTMTDQEHDFLLGDI
jgi:hypothetical protein